MSYIYVLHFDTPLSHARHYIGCTESLRQRLTAHAIGAGSRICRELIERGVTFRLGGLYTCSHRRMRTLERTLKNQHNSDRYCQLCTKDQNSFKGTKVYDIDNIPFRTDSDALRLSASLRTGQTVRLTGPDEPETTMQQILLLMRKDKDALGFIPAGGEQGLQVLIPRGRIAIASANGEIIGYAAHTVDLAESRVTIQQCCVRDDARLMGVGAKLIECVQAEHIDTPLIAKVRNDLAANEFWTAIGFEHTLQFIHKTSKSKINQYVRQPKQEETP